VKVIEEEARRAQKDSDAGVRHAQEVLTSAQSALSTVTAERLDLQKRQGRCKTQIEDESRHLAALKADGKSEQGRRKELNDAALEWDAQRAAIEKLDQSLAAYAENPEDRVLSLESKCSRATKERDLARDQLRDEEAAVREASLSAPYSALAEASEEEEALKVALANEEIRTEALKLLRETVSNPVRTQLRRFPSMSPRQQCRFFNGSREQSSRQFAFRRIWQFQAFHLVQLRASFRWRTCLVGRRSRLLLVFG
jgi:hypothetical protein